MHTVQIISVNIGQPTIIGQRQGKPVFSGIDKRPVTTDQILLTYTNLAGDQQVETRPKPDGTQLHGGNEKAVYVFPVEHLPLWEEELGIPVGPGMLGENLTTVGVVEADVRIGDIWHWGPAVLEVSKPRTPCSKLSLKMGTDMIRRMRANGHCGWYLRVIEPGLVPTKGQIQITQTDTSSLTITERFAQKVLATK